MFSLTRFGESRIRRNLNIEVGDLYRRTVELDIGREFFSDVLKHHVIHTVHIDVRNVTIQFIKLGRLRHRIESHGCDILTV